MKTSRESIGSQPPRRLSTRALGAAVVATIPAVTLTVPTAARASGHFGHSRYFAPHCMSIGESVLGPSRTPSSMWGRVYATLNCSLHASKGWVTAGVHVAGRTSSPSTNLGYAAENEQGIGAHAFAWCKHDGYVHRHEVSCDSSRQW